MKRGKMISSVLGGPGDKEKEEKDELRSEEFIRYGDMSRGGNKKKKRMALQRLDQLRKEGHMYKNPDYNMDEDPRDKLFADKEEPKYAEYLYEKGKQDIKKYYKQK